MTACCVLQAAGGASERLKSTLARICNISLTSLRPQLLALQPNPRFSQVLRRDLHAWWMGAVQACCGRAAHGNRRSPPGSHR